MNAVVAKHFLLYRKYRVSIKCESDDSYRAKIPAEQDAHLTEL